MEQQLSLHLKNFNRRVQVMNQTNAKDLTFSAIEVRNLQAEIFELLAHIADLTASKDEQAANEVVNIGMDGGGF